jgi:hypothetical protein
VAPGAGIAVYPSYPCIVIVGEGKIQLTVIKSLYSANLYYFVVFSNFMQINRLVEEGDLYLVNFSVQSS